MKNLKYKVLSVGAALLIALSTFLGIRAQAPPPAYANFEPAQTNPIRLSHNGKLLFAVNTANDSLSVFNVSQPGKPVLTNEIPVGVGPVSVNQMTNGEVWVVNQVSNTISVITLPQSGPSFVNRTIDLRLSQGNNNAEPMDVVFTGGSAYVSLARSNKIVVIDTTTGQLTSTIPLFGDEPRAMAVSPDGSTVYAALALAGNGTTIISGQNPKVPPQCGTPGQPNCDPPINPALPAPPQVGVIVAANDPKWYPSTIKFTMPANGVAAIKTGATPSVSYYSHVGTINLGMAVNPQNGDIYVANTDALNVIAFEPNLCGHWVNNQITRIQVSTGVITPVDLNPGINYGCPPANPAANISIALAQPTNVVFDPSGNFMYVAAFGTDRVAKVDTDGNVLGFAEVALPSGSGANVDPANKRGPRGLALNASAGILYSLNRIANTISIIPTSLQGVTEIPVGTDLTPAAIKSGRGFLYDAKLSGTGNGACASCHVDAEMDHLAWNLGDPTGSMSTYQQDGRNIRFHPMKGPMTTQTLRGLINLAPYHWRGDKEDFAAFNVAFQVLLAGNQLSTSDMDLYTSFINSILYLPNPNRNLDNTLPTSQNGGNASAGLNDFLTVKETNVPAGSVPGVSSPAVCQDCHTANPGPGTSRVISLGIDGQAVKIPQLRALYQKQLYTPKASESIDGFGDVHDGSVPGLAVFLGRNAFSGYTQAQKNDLLAFLMCFDTGTAPAVGYTRTLTSASVQNATVQADWTLLQQQATIGNVDLIARGTIQGKLHGLLYQPSNNWYISDTSGLGPFTQANLQSFVTAGDTLNVMGVFPGTGTVGPGQ